MKDLDQLIRTRRTIVCVGPGGVGKTTTSAALALRAATLGYRTLVLTVDPAHRLANALGLSAFESEEQEIDCTQLSTEQFQAGGALFAMMLDTKRTFDGVVEKYAPSPDVRKRILASPFYEQASTRLAGSQEYMAMEKLYELHEAGRYDRIILDTPPTVHALDFLQAPERLEDFMTQNTEGLLARSTRTLGRLGLGFMRANSLILRGVGRFLGTDLFLQILEFLQDWKSMYTGFKQRASEVKVLMRSDAVAFVILTGPGRASIDEGLFFHEQLATKSMPFGAFVVNRTRFPLGSTDETLTTDLRTDIEQSSVFEGAQAANAEPIADQLIANYSKYLVLVNQDALELNRLQRRIGAEQVVTVRDFEEDIHSLTGLHQYAQALCVPFSQPTTGTT